MGFFRHYLKQRRRVIAVFLLCCAVFFATFALYALPLGAVLYPALLCAVVLLIAALFDVQRARIKHRQLQSIAGLSAALMEDVFPPEETIDDADYQTIIRLLRQEQRALAGQMDARFRDTVDYYTLWAHQIKTPIASMRITLQGEDSPRARRLSADLLHIEQYVEMVLVFLRLGSDSTDYVIRSCDLDDILRGAVKKFAGEFIGRKIRLEYQPTHETVLTDEKWLSFVIEQLLSNALKYTPEGSVRIEMEPNKTLCIRDTGIGIAPEDLPRIFEKGYTGCNGRVDKRASGIGLYLCRRICANLGHTISAESVVGAGTTIRIGLQEAQLEIE